MAPRQPTTRSRSSTIRSRGNPLRASPSSSRVKFPVPNGTLPKKPSLPASAYKEYQTVWKEINLHVLAKLNNEAILKSAGDPEYQVKIEDELNAKFGKVCDGAYLTLQLQEFFPLMTDHLKMAFYELSVWEQMCDAHEAFPGDASALIEFREWYSSTPADARVSGGENCKVEEVSDSEGSADLRLMVGNGEIEDRYADGETDSTDGGAKLLWY